MLSLPWVCLYWGGLSQGLLCVLNTLQLKHPIQALSGLECTH